jgi:hypothetical protein
LGDVFDGETEFACKFDVLFTEYIRLPLSGFVDEYILGSRPKNTPDARAALEFSTSTDAQLLNINLFRDALYSTYGVNVVVSHSVALLVEYEETRRVAVRVAVEPPVDGVFMRMCG